MSPGRERLKAALEWGAAAVLAALVAPVVVVLAAAVAATSPGGPLYVAPRLGRRGRPFPMLKLRTMLAGAPLVVGEDARTVVTADDPRVTRIGRVLRRGLDELPQLANILAGHMSLVGPRPDPDWMLPRYTAAIARRLDVRPGITGLAQVLESRSSLTLAETYALDVWYLEHHSFSLDAWILGATFAYLAGFGGAGRRRLEALRRQGVLDAARFAPRPALASRRAGAPPDRLPATALHRRSSS